MLKRLLFAATITLPFSIMPARAAGLQAPASEESKTRLSKQEIIDLMVQTGRMPRPQRDSRMDSIREGHSTTPRSDFTFCMGLAYLGNYKAQACVGNAYEKGLGIVEDLLEAYTWYALALESPGADNAARQRLEADRERTTERLRSAYPAPSDDDLDDLVKAQRMRIAQYREEAAKRH